MGRFLAFIYDGMMSKMEKAGLREWRRDLLGGLGGDVLEVGAGTGANLEAYPAAVTKLVLAEPDRFMRRRLERAAAKRPGAAVSDASLDGLDFPDASFDAVVCTLVLCSVSDPARALAEVRRVLRPGGRFIFLEHVAAAPGGRLKWQRRFEPLWRRIFNGCHLTRDTAATIEAAGLQIERLEREDMRKAVPLVRPSIRGVARAKG